MLLSVSGKWWASGKEKNEFIEAISLSTCIYFTLMVVDASHNLREMWKHHDNQSIRQGIGTERDLIISQNTLMIRK